MDHGGSTPVSIGSISTKNVTINQQLVQGDFIQAGGITSTGEGITQLDSSTDISLPPPPMDMDLPPPPMDMDLPPPPMDMDLPPPPMDEEQSPAMRGENDLPPAPDLPNVSSVFVEETLAVQQASDATSEFGDATPIIDEEGTEWLEDKDKNWWYRTNGQREWTLFES